MAQGIVVVGSHAPGILIHVNRPPVAGETVIGWNYEEPMDGGKGSLQAIASARLGASVSFVGKFGRDRLGEQGAQWLREAGVDLSQLKWSDTTATGAGFIILDANGVPAMITAMGANAELSRADIDAAEELISRAGVLLTQFEIPVEIALYAAHVAKRSGVTTIVNPAPAPNGMYDLSVADILTPNETEALTLLHRPTNISINDPLELAGELRVAAHVQTVIVTLGESGVAVADGDDNYLMPAPTVELVDTSGAGDAFNAALAVALARGDKLQDAISWACNVAALSVTRAGTIAAYPTMEEVREFMNRKAAKSLDGTASRDVPNAKS
jgi:ribokinase